MTVESASYISQLDATLPTATDPKSEGDNQLRLIKTVLKTQFPNFGTAAMTASHTELNYMVGVTSAVQTQLNARALKAGDTYTGTHNFSGATSVTVPTATAGDNSTKAASTAFVAATAFSSALPAQTGNAGKILSTDGTTASWGDTFTTSKTITGDFTLSGTARRIYGDLDNNTHASRLIFTSSDPSATSATLGVAPRSFPGLGGSFRTYANIDPDNSASCSLFCDPFSAKSGINSHKTGTGLVLPISLQIDGADALQIDTNRNIRSIGGGAIGYGAGSGGTVTQVTSKSTAVTLNTVCGQVTTSNSALAAGATVVFLLNNSKIEANDFVYVQGTISGSYLYRAGGIGAGQCAIYIQNITAGSLSDALTVRFAVIKGSVT